MLRLYLVRHGWTAWHSEGRLAGWHPVTLDARGRFEAQAAGRWLAAHLTGRPRALVSSPVRRALETAEHIARSFNPPLETQVQHGLADTRIDEWEGRLTDEITATDPRWSDFYSGPADFRFPGGETGREVQTRVIAAVRELQAVYDTGDLILVSHADPLRGLIAHFLGLEANHYYRLSIDCGSISLLSLPSQRHQDRPSPRARLDFLNMTEHLKGAGQGHRTQAHIATAARIDTEPQSGPEALVSLRPITQTNLSAILGLRPSSAQQAFVASNAVSLAEAHFDENAWYRAIYADEVPVGFVMVSDDGASHETFLWRLMVDQRYQRQGFGRRAVKLLIDYVKTRPGATELLVSHGQGDGNPGPFYQDLGFQYTGDRIGGELVMRLPLE